MQDLWTAVIAHLKSDETFAGLVGNRIWYRRPNAEVTTFPAVRLLLVGDLPNVNVPGDYEVRLQIDVTGVSASQAWPVVRLIESLLRYPTVANPEPIETETYWIRGALPRGTVEIESQRDNPGGGGKLVQLSTDWTLKITQKAP